MTSSIQAYNFVLLMINGCDNYFGFRCVDLAIDEFGKSFTEYKAMKGELIDARCDRYKELYQKPNIQIKNQNNEPR